MRVKIVLACTVCGLRSYSTSKNKKNTSERLEVSKYCRRCGKHSLHRETR